MLELQNYLREQVKRVKWEKDISYRTIAEELLEMNYNSFINWLHGYSNLGTNRARKLYSFIEDIL